MKRVRLTKRLASARKADSATPETAIDLGKNRTYHKIDEYHTFEQSVNHELPDMRHDWKDNPRTETGHGIPKMAKVYLAAKKATKLAMLLLGEKAKEDDIEGQARAFMRMGDAALTASLSRYAEANKEVEGDTVCNCASDKDACGEKTSAQCEECDAADEAKTTEQAVSCNAGEEKAQDETPATEQVATCNASDDQATTCNAGEEKAQAETPATEQAPAEEVAEADGDIEIDDAGIDTDVSFEDEDAEVPADADAAELRACFADDEEVAPAEAPAETQTRKAGLKKLAGQPTLTRVASSKSDDLASLWDKWENPSI